MPRLPGKPSRNQFIPNEPFPRSSRLDTGEGSLGNVLRFPRTSRLHQREVLALSVDPRVVR
jgi:hypothetical protein